MADAFNEPPSRLWPIGELSAGSWPLVPCNRIDSPCPRFFRIRTGRFDDEYVPIESQFALRFLDLFENGIADNRVYARIESDRPTDRVQYRAVYPDGLGWSIEWTMQTRYTEDEEAISLGFGRVYPTIVFTEIATGDSVSFTQVVDFPFQFPPDMKFGNEDRRHLPPTPGLKPDRQIDFHRWFELQWFFDIPQRWAWQIETNTDATIAELQTPGRYLEWYCVADDWIHENFPEVANGLNPSPSV